MFPSVEMSSASFKVRLHALLQAFLILIPYVADRAAIDEHHVTIIFKAEDPFFRAFEYVVKNLYFSTGVALLGRLDCRSDGLALYGSWILTSRFAGGVNDDDFHYGTGA